MAKTYSKEELQELANETFAQYPNANKVFATVDGNVFLERNRANIHATPKGQVLEFDRPIVSEETKEKNTPKLSADDSIKQIGEITEIEALEPFKADTRKTVVKAVEDKIAELTASKQ